MGAPNGNVPAIAQEIPSHFIGGNRLDQAPPSRVKDFVAEHAGHSVITSVSISTPQQRGPKKFGHIWPLPPSGPPPCQKRNKWTEKDKKWIIC